MATTIVTKNSSTAAAVPTAGQLVQGELAVNVADKRLFTEDNGGTIVEVGTNPSTLTVTGEITANGGIALGDNDRLKLGDGPDLQIWHNGSNSYVMDSGTGNLKLLGSAAVEIQSQADNSNMIVATAGGAVTLYNANNPKLATTSTGIDVTGSIVADGLNVQNGSNAGITFDLTENYSPFIQGSQSISNLNLAGVGGGGVRVYTSDKRRILAENNGDISFYEDTGTTAKFFWDASAESLGIGTSSPTQKITIADDYPYIHFNNTSNVNQSFIGWNSNLEVMSLGTVTAIPLIFDTNNTERMRIDSSGSVGIGNNNPSNYSAVGAKRLVVGTNVGSNGITIVGATNAYASLAFADSAGSGGNDDYAGLIQYSHITNGMNFFTNSTQKMTIDSSGNVGIGTSSPSSKFVTSDAGGAGLEFIPQTSNNRTTMLSYDRAANAYQTIDFDSSDVHFNISGTERMRIDQNGTLLLTTPSGGAYGYLNVKEAGGGDVRFGMESGIDYDAIAGTWSNNAMKFYTNSSERMRIDASGNLLIGKTTTGVAGAGTVIRAGGELFVTRAGDVMNLNRLTSDGEILVFRKDGVSVGSISTNANSLPSDRNFKKNITDLTLGLDFVKSLSPKTYNFKIDDEGQAVMAGLIAQEVEESLTAAGVERNSMTLLQHEPTEDVNESDYKMDYVKFVPVLINAMKEQQTLIESLTARIAALEE